jgi:hypothetical protein
VRTGKRAPRSFTREGNDIHVSTPTANPAILPEQTFALKVSRSPLGRMQSPWIVRSAAFIYGWRWR